MKGNYIRVKSSSKTGIRYGTNMIIPNTTEAIALTKTHPALTSFAYLIFTLNSCDMVSLNASMTLLNASAINTNAIKNPTAIHAVWDISRSIPSSTTNTATTN
ncbi:MAG: hypothetical protein US29_C0056G0006 [candidate division WS6 bacterium GW2011_GWF1_36_8]|uniref:Uncharacterized protein n=1 Tax=candidate division WS6 bacterium GW2011_GWF1_36_8 TaxID=1619098 RepID=A0A0G0FML5_9BACT|nr:MAG: hypothetical protein US29_C0056G0006 [candidate division WS6 bacterium GW2011_GWF1_36_8]